MEDTHGRPVEPTVAISVCFRVFEQEVECCKAENQLDVFLLKFSLGIQTHIRKCTKTEFLPSFARVYIHVRCEKDAVN